ncbi:zinc ribbon domain-containing protein [Haladaptatus sp. W1]|uniref:zinc ribbon domain-containing protein n=1 Tax=Haladaptatus sp. W1 TaxID=1897478 RepID=UPI000A424B7B|nr:zinc ribbon domain-containing protein [Haladaptatus sp. W1]
MRPHGTSNFCSQCGSALSPGDSFCSQCGSAVGAAGDGRRYTRGAGTRHPQDLGFRRRVEDLTVEGWDVKHDYGERVVMVNRGFGSIPLHILLLMSTSGVGNLLYAWYCYSPGADRIELRADGSEEYFENEGVSTGWSAKSALGFLVSSFFGVFGVLFGSFLLLTNWAGAGLVFGTASLLLGLFLLLLAPKHVPGFKSPTTFGRVRSTDEKTVFEPATPCSVCAEPVGNGVKRTYHERTYVAGIPVRTVNEGDNHYCRSCARGDFESGGAGVEPDATGTAETEFV